MRDLFKEYFPIGDKEFEDLWTRGLVIADTNVLLRLYRYGETAVSEITTLLSTFEDRLWIPHQVAWEYNRRRLTKIRESERSYKDLVAEFQGATEGAKRRLEAMKGFGIHPTVELSNAVNDMISDIDKRISSLTTAYAGTPTSTYYDDLHEKIASLYENKVGSCPTDEELSHYISTGESRFLDKCPPGFIDVEEKRKRGASPREQFGDLIIWLEILREAKRRNAPVIFITEDTKEDWWLREEGKTIGPLPALRREFWHEVNQIVHFYRIGQFIEQANRSADKKVSAATVDEVEEAQESKSELDSFNRELLAKMLLEHHSVNSHRWNAWSESDKEKFERRARWQQLFDSSGMELEAARKELDRAYALVQRRSAEFRAFPLALRRMSRNEAPNLVNEARAKLHEARTLQNVALAKVHHLTNSDGVPFTDAADEIDDNAED